MFLYPGKSGGGPVPVSTFMVPRICLRTGAVLGDGLPRFASVFRTFCETHVTKYCNLHRFHPSTSLEQFKLLMDPILILMSTRSERLGNLFQRNGSSTTSHIYKIRR